MEVIRVSKFDREAKESSKGIDQHREQVRQMIESCVRAMVDLPQQVQVSFSVGERTTVFQIDCPKACFGKIMGKEGKTINALRTVTLAMTANFGYRSIVQIPEPPAAAQEAI